MILLENIVVRQRSNLIIIGICFSVRVLVMIRLMFVNFTLVLFGFLSGHLLRNSSPLDWPFVLIVFWFICIF